MPIKVEMSVTVRGVMPGRIWFAKNSGTTAAAIWGRIHSKTLEGQGINKPFKPYASARTAKGRKHVDLYDTGTMIDNFRVSDVTVGGAFVKQTDAEAARYGPYVNRIRPFLGLARKDLKTAFYAKVDELIDANIKQWRAIR